MLTKIETDLLLSAIWLYTEDQTVKKYHYQILNGRLELCVSFLFQIIMCFLYT